MLCHMAVRWLDRQFAALQSSSWLSRVCAEGEERKLTGMLTSLLNEAAKVAAICCMHMMVLCYFKALQSPWARQSVATNV